MPVSRRVAALALCCLLPGLAGSVDELPEDDFLEFLAVWDEAWAEACDEQGGQASEEDACLEPEDDDDDEENPDN